jgi:phage terminase small subunit
VTRLTEKQLRFVEAYTGQAKGNATESARLAGYSGNERALAVRGSELLRNRKVIQAIEEANAEVRSAAIATREEIQAYLTAMMRGEYDEPTVTPMGDVVMAQAKAAARNQAAIALGKVQGMFIERVDVKVEDLLEERLDELEKRLPPDAFQAVLDVLEGKDAGR